MTAHISFTTIDLMIPRSDSLKAKRRVVKSIKDRMRSRFNASVAEIAYLDEWQRSLISIAMISNDRKYLERGFTSINRLMEGIADIVLLDISMEWL